MKIPKHFIIAVCIFSWIFALLTGNDVLTKTTGDWSETTASLIKTSTLRNSGSPARYGTCISYQYQVEGKLRGGKECGILVGFDDRQEAINAIDSYVKENEGSLRVRYLVANPDESHLVVPQKMKRTQYFFIASLASALLFTVLTFKTYGKKSVNQSE